MRIYSEKSESKPTDNDEALIPHQVVGYTVKQGVTLMTAWRIYRGLTPGEVALKLGITQDEVVNIERMGSPQRNILEKLASIYECDVDQLIED